MRHNAHVSSPGVRRARMSDVETIAAIQLRAWHEDQALPGHVLEALDAGDLAMTWASAIVNPPSSSHILLVAEDAPGGAVTGLCAIGPDPSAPLTGELLTLEVDPAARRSGHGSRLMMAGAGFARQAGQDTWITWCPMNNEVVRSFFMSAGWGPDGTWRDLAVDDSTTMRQVRLVTDLTFNA